MIIGLIAVPFIFFNNLFKRFLLAMLLVKQSNIVNIIRYITYLVLVTIFLFLFSDVYQLSRGVLDQIDIF